MQNDNLNHQIVTLDPLVESPGLSSKETNIIIKHHISDIVSLMHKKDIKIKAFIAFCMLLTSTPVIISNFVFNNLFINILFYQRLVVIILICGMLITSNLDELLPYNKNKNNKCYYIHYISYYDYYFNYYTSIIGLMIYANYYYSYRSINYEHACIVSKSIITICIDHCLKLTQKKEYLLN
jgi:hypothetical protein